MKNLFLLIGQIFLPILLLFVPVFIVQQETNYRKDFLEKRDRDIWFQEAKTTAETVRQNSRFRDFVDRMIRAVKRDIQTSYIPLNGKNFVTALKKHLPSKLLTNETMIYVFKKTKSGELQILDDTPEVWKKNSKLFGRVLSGMMNVRLGSFTNQERLNKDIRFIFGNNLDFESWAIYRKGKLTPGQFLGKEYFFHWDTIEKKGRESGGFILGFPISIEDKQFQLKWLVNETYAKSKNLILVFMPLANAPASQTWIYPDKLRKSKLFRKILTGLKQKNIQQAPLGKLIEPYPNIFAMRDFFSLESSYQLLFIGKKPEIKVYSNQKMAFVSIVVFALIIWGFYLIQRGYPVAISMKTWLILIFAYLGVLPLSALYVFGSYSIYTSSEKRIQDRIQEVFAQFEDIDKGFSGIVSHFGKTCEKILKDSNWTKAVLELKGSSAQTSWKNALNFFNNANPSLNLHSIIVYAPGNGKFFFAPENQTWNTRFTMEMHVQVVEWTLNEFACFAKQASEVVQFFPPETETEKAIRRFFDLGIEKDAGWHFWTQRANVTEVNIGNEVLYQYYDFYGNHNFVPTLFILRTTKYALSLSYLNSLFSSLALRKAVSDRENRLHLLPSDEPDFAFGELTTDGLKPIFPKSASFWNSEHGKTLFTVMESSAKSRSQNIRRKSDVVCIANTGNKIDNFVLGAMISISNFQREEILQRRTLIFVIFVLFVIIGLTGFWLARYLLLPLAQIESGLKRVAAGYLDVQIGLKRNDELGILSRTFDEMIIGFRERKDLGRFVSATLEESLEVSASEKELEKPREIFAAVLVSDIREFTTISEKYPAQDVVKMLNHHHHQMTECIQSVGGQVEKFIGDAIIAVFVDQQSTGTAMRQAVEAAKKMMAVHNKIQKEREQQGMYTYGIGIGIDYGKLLVGTIGSYGRLEHACTGLPRDNAETLESFSKKGKFTKIVVSETIKDFLHEFEFEQIQNEQAWELIK